MPLARLAGAPGAIPLLGHTIRLHRSPLGFLSSLPAYGDLVKIRLGRKPALVVCTPDLCQQVLRNPDIFHRRHRRLIQPAFQPARMEGYASIMIAEISSMLNGWRHGQTFDADSEMHRLATRISARALFSAGADESSDTTAAALAWTFHLLGQHAETEKRLHDEVDTVLTGRSAIYSDIPALPFTRAVITESLRIHPPVWLFTRVVKEDTMFAGHLVRSGAVIMLSPYIIHHRADVYPEPGEFDPTRWMEHPPARAGYLPFGDGDRRCIGGMFGLTEAALALASIAARWRLRPVPGIRVRAVPRAVVHPVPLPMRLEIR